MTINYLGGMSVGDACPGAVTLAGAGNAGIALALPDIEARISALLAFNPQPVNFEVSLSLALQTVASIQAAIAAGLPVPDISAQIALVKAQLASLEAALASIQAQLTIIANIQSAFAAAGLHVYAFDGQTQDFGTELQTEIGSGLPGGSPTDATKGLVIATSVSEAWAALGAILSTE